MWGLLILFIAIMQLPPILVLGPMIFHVFSTTGTFGAVVLAVRYQLARTWFNEPEIAPQPADES